MTAKHIESIDELKKLAARQRIDVVKMIGHAGSGHPGGSLSMVELVTALYFNVMRHDPANPGWEDRDRFILSKGHACASLYTALAEAGYIPHDLLMTFRTLDSPLQGHPDRRKLPILEASTGSLGMGLSIGIGEALAAKLDKKDFHTFVLVGDGEIQEGQNWEAALFAPFHKLDNLTLIVDDNKIQLDDRTANVLNIEPLDEKFKAFGWDVKVIDGHDFAQVIPALKASRENTDGKPTVVIANTIKGKGVSFMEDTAKWHGVAPKPADVEAAVKELEAQLA